VTPTHRTIFSFDYRNQRRARTVERSLRPELGAIDGDRTSATVTRDGATLELVIEAEDLVALRAGCNTWLTLSSVAETTASGSA